MPAAIYLLVGRRGRFAPTQYALAGLGVVVGMLPMILDNLTTGFRTVASLVQPPQKLGIERPQISPAVQSVSSRQSPGVHTPARQRYWPAYAVAQLASSAGSMHGPQVAFSHRPSVPPF